ncbi:MAG: radical SAM protein [Lachnospiraceae bacterium]|nr:radical SAM protein [Lachnospiraceae bacterium]
MKNLKEDYFNSFVSHIYIEKRVRNHACTQKILARFPSAEIIEIGHYKEVFCRSRQSHPLQHCSQKLILAARQGALLYEGAPVCQSFGNQYFYYVSCAMNCIYDCEYCYLKGMYPSANLVVFVNLEDIFAEVEKVLETHPLYLCVSYDTDLLALEPIIGYVQEWCVFAAKHENLKIEIRTKCANRSFAQNAAPVPGVIYAFTLSPQAVIEAFEHHTPSLTERLYCAAKLIQSGCPVRLCFDPMIYVPDWRQHYQEMLDQVCHMVDLEKIADVSVGTFRISQDYLKNMRRQEPDSAVIWFPFQREDGYCHYPDDLMEQMECFLTERLAKKIPMEKIFRWKA